MADFQTVVNVYPAKGIPGAYASVNPIVSTPTGYIASGNVNIGAFCWEDSSNAGTVKSTGTGKPLGFVVLERNYPIVSLAAPTDGTAAAQGFVPKGFNVPVAVEGDFYVKVPAAVTKGQKVFVNPTTGAIAGGTAGGTVASSVETDWFFATAADEDEIAIISNWGNTQAIPASAG